LSQLPRACVFDLDGTLVDSLRDIADSVNHCLELLGLPPYPVAAYRDMVGEGIPMLAERAIGQTHPHLVGRLAELARARYRVYPVVHTRPYVGVPELISHLADAGVRLGVLSNKPHDLTSRIVREFWPDGVFATVVGYQDEARRKPSPALLLDICRTLAVSPAELWVVGDTPTDVATARNAGAPVVGVTWGFRTRADLEQAVPDHIIDRPAELLALKFAR
jgi:phosphoglycolate phosphatase